jgi:hypothetical protein
MNIKKLCFAVCAAVCATICLHPPELRAQVISGASVPIEMVTTDGQDSKVRRRSYDGIMEPVGLAIGQGIAITLEVSTERNGQPVHVSPLDGGRINATLVTAQGNVALSGYGTDIEERVFVADDGTIRRESLFVADDGTVREQSLFVLNAGAIRPDSLFVSEDGTVGFSFQPGSTTGLYRVLVLIGAAQYELQLYVVDPNRVRTIGGSQF